jgi:hypothetical protein
MRLVPLVCLVGVVGVPALASADKDKDKDKSKDDDDPPSADVEWGVGAQVRRSHVSTGVQKVFLDGTPGPATQDGGGATFVRRSRTLDIVIGFGYDPIRPAEGYYLSKGGDPTVSGDADYVTFDEKLAWFTADITFIGRAKLHKVLALRFGAGLGIGLVRGDGYRTSAICTSERLQQDCMVDPAGERQEEPTDVPVLPVLNLVAGLELRPFRWLAISADVGLHTAPYVGLGLTLFPWKT